MNAPMKKAITKLQAVFAKRYNKAPVIEERPGNRVKFAGACLCASEVSKLATILEGKP